MSEWLAGFAHANLTKQTNKQERLWNGPCDDVCGFVASSIALFYAIALLFFSFLFKKCNVRTFSSRPPPQKDVPTFDRQADFDTQCGMMLAHMCTVIETLIRVALVE